MANGRSDELMAGRAAGKDEEDRDVGSSVTTPKAQRSVRSGDEGGGGSGGDGSGDGEVAAAEKRTAAKLVRSVSITSEGSVDDGESSNASSSRPNAAVNRNQVHIAHHHAGPHHHHFARAHPNMRGGAGRHRSAIGLMRPPPSVTTTGHRGGTTSRGHGRVPSSSKMSHTSSTSTLPTEESTHSISEEAGPDDGKVEAASSGKEGGTLRAADKVEKSESGKKRAPVTFTMGSMDDESDYEDEEDDEEETKTTSTAAQKAVTSAASVKEKGKEQEEGDSSGDWSSDTSEDSEEERRRAEEQKRKVERDRIDSMFKKIPVRSQSAADISLLGKSPVNEAPGVQVQPTRSLLSSIFHPEEQHHRVKHASESFASRRPHASAVDIAQLQRPLNAGRKEQRRKGSHGAHDHAAFEGASLPRAPSFGNLGALGTLGGGLKMSKSAVALPVLSTTGSRSAASSSVAPTGVNAEQKLSTSSRHRAVFTGDDSGEDEADEITMMAGGGDGASSIAAHSGSNSFAAGSAMERLNELAHFRSKSKPSRPLSLRSSASEQDSDRRRMSGGSAASVGTGNAKRTSLSSLDVQVRPDLDEEAIRQQRRTSMPFETPAVSAPVKLPQRSKSAVNVPDTGLPQSPRTTRRNMMRDELSESLRQNLLWERQSRNRMLGIGMTSVAPAATAQEPHQHQHARSSSLGREPSPSHQQPTAANPPPGPHHHHRPQSVLGGNALRPLTTRNSSSSSNNGRDAGRYTGDFHHTGW